MKKIGKILRKETGFTLVELMAVIAIIGVLSAMLIPQVSSAMAKAKDAKLNADLATLDSALMIYYADNIAYPDTLDDLKTQKYIANKELKDAKGGSLTYTKEDSGYELKGKNSAGQDVTSPGSTAKGKS